MSASPRPPHRSLRRRLAGATVIVLTAVVAFGAPAAGARDHGVPKRVAPRANYLALGDSLAFGYQQAKFNALFPNEDPAAYNTGYVDDFGVALQRIRRHAKTTNLGCPGETTDSFLGSAPCSYHPPFALHVDYSGSQMAAAVAFLKAHGHQTSPITIDIGANDLLAVVNGCSANPAPFPDVPSCIVGRSPAAFAHIAQNLGTILARLRAVTPKTEIIVLGLYNPLVVTLGPASDALAVQANSVMAGVATTFKARFADPLPVFNPPGPNEIPTICTLTAICTPLHDIHATDVGYQALADVIFAASGYGQLD
jgi:lysophospholipase L1-like esterase